MQPRFILRSELDYKKMFPEGIDIYVYPSSKEERETIDNLLKVAIVEKKQLFKKDIDDLIDGDYSDGYAKWLIIIKVLDDAS